MNKSHIFVECRSQRRQSIYTHGRLASTHEAENIKYWYCGRWKGNWAKWTSWYNVQDCLTDVEGSPAVSGPGSRHPVMPRSHVSRLQAPLHPPATSRRENTKAKYRAALALEMGPSCLNKPCVFSKQPCTRPWRHFLSLKWSVTPGLQIDV